MSAALLSLGLGALGALAPQDPAGAPSFQDDVRPLFERSCQGCHQPARAKGGLDLTSHAALLAGGKNGAAVVPGAPDESLLIDEVAPAGALPPSMPEEGEPLSPAEVELLRRWIAAGAPDDTPPAAGPAVGPDRPPVYPRPPVVAALDFAPDGALLAVAGWHEVLLHRADGSGIEARLVGLSERVTSLAFSPDGARLAVAGGTPGRRGELQVWDVAARELRLSLPVTFDLIQGVSWSPDGALLAFGCCDDTLRAVDAQSGAQVLYQGAHEDWVLDTAFSVDGAHLVSVSRDRSMKLVRVDTQQFIDNVTSITPGALKGGLMSVARHPQRDELLVGGADGTPRVYRTFREKKRQIGDDFNLLRAFDPLPGRVFRVAWSPDGARVAAASSDGARGAARVWSAADGAAVSAYDCPTALYALAWHPDGATLAVAGHDGRLRLLDPATGAVRTELDAAPLAPESAGAR